VAVTPPPYPAPGRETALGDPAATLSGSEDVAGNQRQDSKERFLGLF
jgi:hypothetical protein